jgi:hypothetical protein
MLKRRLVVAIVLFVAIAFFAFGKEKCPSRCSSYDGSIDEFCGRSSCRVSKVKEWTPGLIFCDC